MNRDGFRIFIFACTGVLVAHCGGGNSNNQCATCGDGGAGEGGVGEGGTGEGGSTDGGMPPSALDPSFGNAGAVTFQPSSASSDIPYWVARQPDGNVVVGGWNEPNYSLFVMRFTSAGAVDTTYGAGGRVLVPSDFPGAALPNPGVFAMQADGEVLVGVMELTFGGDIVRLDLTGAPDASFATKGRLRVANMFVWGLGVQADGKIVAAGGDAKMSPYYPLMVARFTPAGGTDATFAANGVLSVPMGPASALGAGVAIDPSGDIYVPGAGSILLRRITPAGGIDTTWGGGGVVSTSLAPPFDVFSYRGLGIQSDGKPILVGKGNSGSAEAWRYDTDGTLDATWGTNGVATMTGDSQSPYSVAVTADGHVLVGIQPDVWRLSSSGAPDAAFGTSGRLSSALLGTVRYVLPLADGTAFATGEVPSSSGGGGLAHLTTTGLDGTFGTSGLAPVNMSAPADAIASLLAQPDGKIVAVGTTSAAGPNYAVARFSKDGALDTTFGNGGAYVSPPLAKARGGALDAAGNIVVAGGLAQFTAIRVTPAGALDTTFGTNGQAAFTTGPSQASVCYAVTLDAMGRIVLAGGGNSGAGLREAASVARLTSAGMLDSSFDATGIVSTTLDTTGTGVSAALAVATQTDGKIVIAGTASVQAGYAWTVARYTEAGALDTSFSLQGFNTFTPVASTAQMQVPWQAARAVALQPDGKIVVVGSAGFPLGGIPTPDDFWNYLDTNQSVLAVVRLSADGSLDPSFGKAGVVTADFGQKIVIGDAVTVLADGTIAVGGSVWDGTTKSGFLAKVSSSGTVDNSAAGIGLAPVGVESGIADLLVQPDGKIVAGGNAFVSPTGEDFALVRFKGKRPVIRTLASCARLGQCRDWRIDGKSADRACGGGVGCAHRGVGSERLEPARLCAA